MSDNITGNNELLAKELVATGQSSVMSDDKAFSDTKLSELDLAIVRARSLLRTLNSGMVNSPIEETRFSPLMEDLDEPGKSLTKHGINCTPRDSMEGGHEEANIGTKSSEESVMTTISSLMRALDDSMRQIQQLKLKNMLLKSNSDNLQSSYVVEENLRKQQFERMKYQFLLEKEQLIEKLRAKESKVAKYKSRVMEKNRQINKLTRILNDSAILDTSASETSDSTTRRSVTSIPLSSSSKYKTSDMLKTLGLLASQVLKDEVDEDSGNQTILQVADNTTDSEGLHTPIFDDQLRLPSQVSGDRAAPPSYSIAKN
ncbi:hypothetical protein HG536_0A03130 [Torulaspora globosa]|uniref:Uncharacterized protein n=1 Tax=Torulaspora globosa TaxID=48254 RepID=A0A7G3ZAG0_9SACH|nr:uncharacterized protein HG536_0A03130 [Torulaspora globosa]QLL30496.1 hypothetical protein HG536_0A03130 [Torulaspora globosa]